MAKINDDIGVKESSETPEAEASEHAAPFLTKASRLATKRSSRGFTPFGKAIDKKVAKKKIAFSK